MTQLRNRTALPAGKRIWLADAHPDERLFILWMRRWLDGPCGQAEIWNGMAASLGRARAAHVLRAFEQLLREVATSARRKLNRHGTACPCLGEDEAMLASMVRAAGRGDTETSYAIAAEIMHEAKLSDVVQAATGLGQLMRDLGREPAHTHEVRPTIH